MKTSKEDVMKSHKNIKSVMLAGGLSLILASCGFMEQSEVFLPGERSDILPNQQNINSETALNPTTSLPGNKKGNFGAEISQLWSQNVGFTNNRYNTQNALPALASSRIYTLNNDSEVTALSSAGNILWKARVNREGEHRRHIGGGLTVADGIYVGTGSAQLVKLNTEGNKIWAADVDAPVASAPAVSAAHVYAQTAQGKVFAFNSSNGEEKWRYETAGGNEGFLGNTQPVIHQGKVIVFLNTGRIVALNAQNGDTAWSTDLFNKRTLFKGGSPNAPSSVMRIINGQLIAASAEGQIASLNPNTGKINWSKAYGASNNIEIAGSTIYVIDENEILRAVSSQNGNSLWSVGLQSYKDSEDKRGRMKWFGPAYAGGELYVTSNKGHVIVFSTAGKAVRGKKFGTQFSTSPVASGKTVYVFGNRGRLTAIR